ncbi:MAG: hypothetical protein ACRDTA_07145 [Pseudonocardiaceae bacterium]
MLVRALARHRFRLPGWRNLDGQSSRNSALDPTRPAGLRTCYDRAATFGQTHNRHCDWSEGDPPDTPVARCADHADEVCLCTIAFEVEWTGNASGRAVKDSKQHQAVSG